MEALYLDMTMKKLFHIVAVLFLFFWVGNIRCLGITNDTLITTRWDKVGETGDFTPAGWASDDILALTRVQAIRMGLVIDEYVDERFDPFKGKRAALQFYDEQAPVEVEEVFQYSGGHLLLEDLADEAGVPLRTIEAANPHLRRDILPAGVALYGTSLGADEVKLAELSAAQATYQKGLEEQYERRRKQMLSFMPDPNTHKLITYTVRSGDYLGKISANTGAKVDDIKKWNRIRGNTIYAGQKLNVWVPRNAKYEEPASAAVAVNVQKSKKVIAEALPSDEGTFIIYIVKPGDTLWGIAGKFPGVSADNIKTWNEVEELIKAGDKLRIQTQTISDYSPDKYPSTL